MLEEQSHRSQNGAQRIVLLPEILAVAGAVCQRLRRVERCFSEREREILEGRKIWRSVLFISPFEATPLEKAVPLLIKQQRYDDKLITSVQI